MVKFFELLNLHQQISCEIVGNQDPFKILPLKQISEKRHERQAAVAHMKKDIFVLIHEVLEG